MFPEMSRINFLYDQPYRKKTDDGGKEVNKSEILHSVNLNFFTAFNDAILLLSEKNINI